MRNNPYKEEFVRLAVDIASPYGREIYAALNLKPDVSYKFVSTQAGIFIAIIDRLAERTVRV